MADQPCNQIDFFAIFKNGGMSKNGWNLDSKSCPLRTQFGETAVNAAGLVITATGGTGPDASGNTVDSSKTLEAYIKRVRAIPQT